MKTTSVSLQFIRVVLFYTTLIILFIFLSFSFSIAQTSQVEASRKIADEYDYKNMPIDSTLAYIQKHAMRSFKDAYQVLNELKVRAYASNDARLISEVHYYFASWNTTFFVERVDTTIYHMEKCAEFLEKTDDKILLGGTYDQLAVDYINKNDLEKAQGVIMKAIAIYQELESAEGLALMDGRLASLYFAANEPEKTILYGGKSLEVFKKYDNKNAEIFLILLERMNAFTALEKYNEALKTADEALVVLDKEGKGINPNSRDYYRGYLFLNRGHTHLANKQYEKAMQDYANSETLGWPEDHENKAKILFFQGKNKEALTSLKLAHEAYDFENLELSWSNIRRGESNIVLSQIYEKNGLFKEAYYLNVLGNKGIKDALEGQVENLESEAIIKYETGKKDQALASQELQLEQKTKIQNLTFGILGLLSSLLFGLFYFFRKNRKITQELATKNQQNEVLLKEIHHRVKNNLQTISSLLSLQSKSIDDPTALDAVQESRNRVASMALIHQKLYQGENLAAIEMRDYFKTIGRAVLKSFGDKAKGVELEVNMPEIELDVDTAIPIGLITNELITNSLKYAFQEKESGKISISMTQEEDNLIQLQIADDGINQSTGISEGGTGFGTMLIKLLTTQLKGELKQSTEQGTATIIQFPLNMKVA